MLKVGISTAGWFDIEDPLASLSYIKECGFDAFDLNLNPHFNTVKAKKEGLYPNLFDRSVQEILVFFAPLKKACQQTGVTVSQIHAPYPVWFHKADELNEYLLSVLDKAFAVSAFLGCPAVVVHPVEGDTREEERARNLHIYRSVIPLIQKYKGVKCCLENLFVHHSGRITEGRLSNPDDVCNLHDQLNKEAGGEYFGVCFDVGHANVTDRDIKEFVRRLGSRLTILHIHDNDGKNDQHLAPYSAVTNKKDLVCDWSGFVQGLRDIGYKGVLSFETDLALHAYPPAVHTQVLKLISAIGHYWSDCMEAKDE